MTNHYSEVDRAEDIYADQLSRGYWRDKKGNYRHIRTLTTRHLWMIDALLLRVGDPYNFRAQIQKECEKRGS